MELLLLISILIFGIILIVLEIIFVPGTTFVGIFGFILVGTGVYFVYEKHGIQAGNYTLVSSVLFIGVLLYYSFKSGTWDKLANDSVMSSKVNDNIKMDLNIGDEGETISVLRPMGTVSFNDNHFEVSTFGDFVDANSKVKIVEINNRKIIVEPLNK